jgi:hypothetical protein
MKLTKQILKKLIKETIRENRMTLVEAQVNLNRDQVLDVLRGNTNIRTVGIMSGQNPMAQATTPQQNAELAQALKNHLDSKGMDYKVVKGVFSGHPEESVIIFDPSMEQMHSLNSKFTQWGFVYGKRIGDYMEFSMQQMYTPQLGSDPEMADLERDHYEGGDLGSRIPPDSNYASEIHTDVTNPQGAGRPDNITIIDGEPAVIPLYKGYSDPPLSQLTDPDKFHMDAARKTRMPENKKRK